MKTTIEIDTDTERLLKTIRGSMDFDDIINMVIREHNEISKYIE